LVHDLGRKWLSVFIDVIGEGLGFWVQGSVSKLFYWKIVQTDVLRRCCSGKVTFSFDLHFAKYFHELIWDSELCCSQSDLEATCYLPKCRYDEDEVELIYAELLEFKKYVHPEPEMVVQVWRSCLARDTEPLWLT
jgi:hypothetical protein